MNIWVLTVTWCHLARMYLLPTLYYKEKEIINGISLLEQCILDAIEMLGDPPPIVFGDTNARTGSDNTTETNDDYCETLTFLHRMMAVVLMN